MESVKSGKYLNKAMIIGVIINVVLAAATFAGLSGERFSGTFKLIMLFFLSISFVGLIISAFFKRKTGPYLVIVGSIVFFPIGIVAMLGARKILDDMKREQFNS